MKHVLRAAVYLAEIVALAAVNIGFVIAAQMALGDDFARHERLILVGAPLATLAAMWIVLRLHGQGWGTIGLKRIENPVAVIAGGLAIMAGFFAGFTALEYFGVERDLSGLRADLHGNAGYLAFSIGFAFIGPGLYEEAMFRGFAMQRIACAFGDGRIAWGAAVIGQAALFGLAHGHQGMAGVLLTGGAAAVLGVIFLANGRTLWPLILGHALYDSARFVMFYLGY